MQIISAGFFFLCAFDVHQQPDRAEATPGQAIARHDNRRPCFGIRFSIRSLSSVMDKGRAGAAIATVIQPDWFVSLPDFNLSS
jgi:hypothetical protein